MSNNSKLFFFMVLIMSNIMMMFTNFWMNLWIWLEINMICFILLLINKKNFNSLESSLIYFLIQTIASIVLICGIIFNLIFKKMFFLIITALLMKLSIAPLHFWMPMMVESMNWMMNMMLFTWQKIGPLIILNYYYYFNFFFFFLIFSNIISSLMGLNFSSLKKILSYSSINQMSWIIMSLLILNKMFKMYLFFYFFIMFLVTYSFYIMKMKFIYDMYMNKNNKMMNIFIFCNLLSLGGLPPLLGFFPKMMIINKMNYMFMTIMILFTMITLFFYIRIMISTMLLNNLKMISSKKKENLFKKKNLMMMMLMNNMMMLMIFILY